MAGSFAILLAIVPDQIFVGGGGVKNVLMASPLGVGAWSLELFLDGSIRVYSTHATGDIIRRTAAGLVQPEVTNAIGYSRSSTEGTQRVWINGF